MSCNEITRGINQRIRLPVDLVGYWWLVDVAAATKAASVSGLSGSYSYLNVVVSMCFVMLWMRIRVQFVKGMTRFRIHKMCHSAEGNIKFLRFLTPSLGHKVVLPHFIEIKLGCGGATKIEMQIAIMS